MSLAHSSVAVSHLLAAPLALGLCVYSAHAATLNPVADTHLNRDSVGSNYGSEIQIQVTNDGGSELSKGKDNIGIFRFDLSAAAGPFTAASFTVTGDTQDLLEFQLWGVGDGEADENFDELALTFDTFAYGTTATDSSGDGSFNPTGLDLLADGITDASDGSPDNVYTFNTAALLDFVNADANGIVTLILFRTSDDGARSFFASREALSGAPQLTLVPEPASLALLGLGGLLVASRRRRQG